MKLEVTITKIVDGLQISRSASMEGMPENVSSEMIRNSIKVLFEETEKQFHGTAEKEGKGW